MQNQCHPSRFDPWPICGRGRALFLVALLNAALACACAGGETKTPVLKLTGDWQLEVNCPGAGSGRDLAAVVAVAPASVVQVNSERYDQLPLFNTNAGGGWTKGQPLRGLAAQECTTPGLLEGSSLRLCAGAGPDAEVFELVLCNMLHFAS
jgi:hypothetical protein